MAKKTTHTQCALKHDDGRIDTAFIPTRYAKVCKRLRIKGEEGWTVTATYAVKDTDKAMADSRDYLRTREASDV